MPCTHRILAIFPKLMQNLCLLAPAMFHVFALHFFAFDHQEH